MARVLHLWKADAAPLAAGVLAAAVATPGDEHTLVQLDGTPPPALPATVRVRRLAPDDLDYAGLVDLIFEADRVVAW
jgi:hypothetical protein